MAVYERGKVLFHLKDTIVSGTWFTGAVVASVKIVECDPITSILLVIPSVDRENPALTEPVIIDHITINNRTELKPDQRIRLVELSEYPHMGHDDLPPSFTLTVHLGCSVVFWAFMAAYASAMSRYYDHQFAVEDLVNSMINEDTDDDDEDNDTEGNSGGMEVNAEPHTTSV
ncbi:hypothetical protein L227DRAFT_613191 [Lentinus tigrinus ALCF2SS1-6]|uniref:Uncharacterized protein n=1 Tax=Lentinus tigrinus ALCF2SS1-6 TaxID=1328759 RepID=A0A5C2S567_9APHY|nr:hypothetical protein L227DRAFT_613191 [Lentinus tigrinus ALCF2SS1-6]